MPDAGPASATVERTIPSHPQPLCPPPPPAAEPAAPTFSRARLEGASGLRSDPAWISELLADSKSRAIAVRGDAVLVCSAGEQRLARVPVPAEVSRRPILLGLEQGAAVFAVDLDCPVDLDHRESSRGSGGGGTGEIISLREAGALLPAAEGGLAAYAVALIGWHRRHGFCARCGAPTMIAEAGLSRHCHRCGASHFPRTDPVVIVLVEHDGRLLLGRPPQWPERRYSLLAGFVAAGETAEEAVRREVLEESGITVDDVRYVASQPWPFPASLMLGFRARADGGNPHPRDAELQDVRWFELEVVRNAAAGARDGLVLPPPVSIARFMIDLRLAGRL